MKHRVRVNMAFDTEEEAKAFMAQAKSAINTAKSINEDRGNDEIAYIEYHLCYHDEPVPKPCQVLERQEVHQDAVVMVKELAEKAKEIQI